MTLTRPLLLFLSLVLALICAAHSEKILYSSTGDQWAFIRSPITDSMVVQRDVNATLYGVSQGKPGMTLKLTIFNERTMIQVGPTYVTQSDVNTGEWKFGLESMPASGPFLLQFSTANSAQYVNVSNVMFGDVFLCSGQSNMDMPVWQNFNAEQYLETAVVFADSIRLLHIVPNVSIVPLLTFEGDSSATWTQSTEKNVKDFSALCYFTARRVYSSLQRLQSTNELITIGLIQSTYGGTPVESWSSPDALDKCPPRVVNKHDPPKPYDDLVLFNAMINPLFHTNFKSIMWYQGESNSFEPDKYKCLFSEMILDWRVRFSKALSNDMVAPFNFVQLAAYDDPGFIMLRWSQQLVRNSVAKTGMATAIDLGDPTSPFHPIHPRLKDLIAARMTPVVLYNTYNLQVPFDGPEFYQIESVHADNDGTWRIAFVMNNSNGGIVAKGTMSCTQCCQQNGANAFSLIGNDSRLYSMVDVDLGMSHEGIVVITSASIPHDVIPTGIVYAWEAYPQCILYNRLTTLPATPFWIPLKI